MDAATRDAVREGAKQSAAAVLPIVFAHLGTPAAILDVGTGEGHWREEALGLGVRNAYGVDVELLTNTTGRWDAEEGEPLAMFNGDERWPLALCLEMAEHVSPVAGGHLVRELCRVSEAVLWSAAIPGQGGDGHVNEQWPDYWTDCFNEHDWILTDPYRERIWQESGIEPWYRQNLLLARPLGSSDPVGVPRPRALVDPVTWAFHRGVNPPEAW
jgi:hypothetical protein